MLVSILITTYDHGRFLGDAIESAAAQEYEPLELVIIDDGSRDDSQRVIARAQSLHRMRFRRFASLRLRPRMGPPTDRLGLQCRPFG